MNRLIPFLRDECLQLFLVLAPLLAALIAQPYAVEPVPIHWNLNGEADGFAAKQWGLLLTPGLVAFLIVVIFLFESRDRHRLREDGSLSSHGQTVRTIRLGLSFFFAALFIIQIFWALGHPPDSSKWIPFGAAVLIAFVGNFFGKLKPNRYVGIRVPWTLNSEQVWRQTHRFAGWLWTGSGLLFAVFIWLVPAPLLSVLTIVWLLALVAVPLFFAWRCARLEKLPE